MRTQLQTELTAPPISMLEQASDTLLTCASRLRCAHANVRSGEWSEPVAESEEMLRAAADKVERLRLSLLRITCKPAGEG